MNYSLELKHFPTTALYFAIYIILKRQGSESFREESLLLPNSADQKADLKLSPTSRLFKSTVKLMIIDGN